MRFWFALLLAVLLAFTVYAFTMPYSPGYSRGGGRGCRHCEPMRPCWRHQWFVYNVVPE